ncbi:hypothetical protein ACH5RR_016633 [Cinchona calisaya]|uniref:Uncharacterized protein n=1 Tax=Cinchona calisaya TaxID=153742 RepID=A0ABD2ZWI7_9GENT
MKSLSSVGLGLSLVFGCLFLALVAELYYLLWWKKRIPSRDDIEDGYSSSNTGNAREFSCRFCWKKKLNPQHFCSSSHEITLVHDPQAQHHGNSNKDLWPFGEDMHNFSGPPRFLFTIKEETKEDLESHEDAKSRGERSRKGSRSKSLSDIFHIVETPFLTPVASPPYFTPPLTPLKSYEAEFNWLRSSSPPPMFQFLKDDAEEKLWGRSKITEEIDQDFVHRNDDVPSTSMFLKDEESGSYITLNIVNWKKQEELSCPDVHVIN